MIKGHNNTSSFIPSPNVAIINDSIISLLSTWSSDKISTIAGVQIDDSIPSLTKVYSSQKVEDLLASVGGNTISRDCSSLANVGDIVIYSNTNNYVDVITDNTDEYPAIGVIIEKSSPTIAKVQLYGICTVSFAGLVKGEPVYISTLGSLTNIPPTSGYLQIFGIAYDNNKVFINPTYQRSKRNPF